MAAKAENVKKFDPSKLKVVKRVTLPTLKLQPNAAVYVKITDPMFEGKKNNSKDDDDNKKAPMIFNVIDLTDGEPKQMVAGTVVQKEILENYEKNSYVGKCFEIIKGQQKGSNDRKYYTYQISEIEDPAA